MTRLALTAAIAIALIAPASAQTYVQPNPVGSFFWTIVDGTHQMVDGAIVVVTSPLQLARPYQAPPPRRAAPRRVEH
jgi:hypothetical protein